MKNGLHSFADPAGLAVSVGLIHSALTAPKLLLVRRLRARTVGRYEAVAYPAAKVVGVACAVFGNSRSRSAWIFKAAATASVSYVEFVNASITPTAWNQRSGALLHGLVWTGSTDRRDRNNLLGWLLVTSSAQSVVAKMLATRGLWTRTWTAAGALSELGSTRGLRALAHRRKLVQVGANLTVAMEALPVLLYSLRNRRKFAMVVLIVLHTILWGTLNISFFHRLALAIGLLCDHEASAWR